MAIFASRDFFFEVRDIALRRSEKLRGIEVAERIGREISERASRPMHVLQNAYCVIRYRNTEICFHLLIPDFGKIAGMKRSLTTILRNRFYIGLMPIQKTGQTFEGSHEPLATTHMFETAQAVLAGKRVDRSANHVFTYSRIVRCGSCNYSLIAERQKGHVYYRCHDRPFKNPAHCPPTSIREEQLDEAVLSRLRDVDLSEDEVALARTRLEELKKERAKNQAITSQALRLQVDQMQGRLEKLADALVDGTIDKRLFQNKQDTLLRDQARIKEKLAEIEKGACAALTNLTNTVELAKSPSMLYKTASPERKRQLLKTLLSNLVVSEKNVEITLTLPFRLIAERDKTSIGRAAGNRTRSLRTRSACTTGILRPDVL